MAKQADGVSKVRTITKDVSPDLTEIETISVAAGAGRAGELSRAAQLKKDLLKEAL